jgi:hypothetical protein
MKKKSNFGKKICVDFDDGMSPELRKSVLATETCQRFLFERQRVGDLAEQILAEGGHLNSRQIIAESTKLDVLVLELYTMISLTSALLR